jgi:hypothetical protein
MILATQSASDLTNTEALRPILENCPTQILLANPKLDARLYGDVLRLTESEQGRVRNLIPKRQFLLKQGDVSKILNLNVDKRSYWLYTTNPFEAKPSPMQRELIRAAAARLRAGAEITAAMDADAGGRELAEVVRHAVAMSGRADLHFDVHEPAGFKDWNDQLRAKPRPLIRHRHEEPSVA